MTEPIPRGHEGLIPHLVCDPCADAIEFYKKAFGAEEGPRVPTPDGQKLLHAEVRIGGRPLYLCDDFPEHCGGQSRSPRALGTTPITIHQFVPDCDAAIRRAEQAGATVVLPPQDMFWGDRYGVITDPFGHSWSLATHISDPSPEEMAAAAQAMFSAGQE